MDLVRETVWVALSEYILHIISNRICIFLHTKYYHDLSSFGMEDGGEVGSAQPEHITHFPYEITMLTTVAPMLHLKKKKKIIH